METAPFSRLVGYYEEDGVFHGKPCFKKFEAGGEDVFLCYWDTRNGHSFAGWWFGTAVGGADVWTRHDSAGDAPPLVGWRFPWDGDVDLRFSVCLSVGPVEPRPWPGPRLGQQLGVGAKRKRP